MGNALTRPSFHARMYPHTFIIHINWYINKRMASTNGKRANNTDIPYIRSFMGIRTCSCIFCINYRTEDR